MQLNCSTLSSLLGEAWHVPIDYQGSHLGDHGRHKSMVETSVVSCESWSCVACMQGTVGENKYCYLFGTVCKM